MAFISGLTFQTMARAAEGASAEAEMAEGRPLERIMVIGTPEKREEMPGSAQLIDKAQLEKFEYEDIHRILRLAPGVNIQEEDGYGLRPNIGLRGSGVERSSKITLMEDGVLIAPAPYASPSAYYFPTAGRMERVEVLKGPAAIKYGPQTVGGAINLVSTSIPNEPSGRLDARLGSDSQRQLHAWAGGSTEHLGALVETFQSSVDGFKNLDGGGDTGFEIEDYLAKVRLNTAEDAEVYQSLELKFSYTDQESDETYLGLTDGDFTATPYRRYAASAEDLMLTEHWQVQASHLIEFSDMVDVTTVAYYNDFKRNWFKLNNINLDGRLGVNNVLGNPAAFPDAIAILRGEQDSPDDALELRNNNRKYYAWGVQSILGLHLETGEARHDIELSVRYHEDEEDRLQNEENYAIRNGVMVPTSIEAIGSQANREAYARAWSFYIRDEITWGDFRLTPGVRIEEIKLVRDDYATNDPDRSEGPTRTRKNTLTAVTPGIGLNWNATEELSVLAGVHRGFSPPGPGSTDEKEEKSVNYEAGLRYNNGEVAVEAIGFFSDYSNILGTCTNSVGCTVGDIGDQFNGGAVDVLGLELMASTDLGATGNTGLSFPVSLAYTYTDAEFKSDFADGFWGDVTSGDSLPYIPEHQLNLLLGVAGDRWGADLNMNYLSSTRTEAGSGPIPEAEKVDGRIVLDLSARYQLTDMVGFFGAVENLTDNTYAVARRPLGLRPGKPRTFMAGVTVTF